MLIVLALVVGCDGPQSALAPAGRDAERIAELFWWMAIGALVVWLIVMALAIYAVRVRPKREHDWKKTRLFVIGGGALWPTVVLTVLLAAGLSMMPDLIEHGPADGPQIHVSGEQWWWRVRYELQDGTQFELANELRLPRGRRMPLWLVSPDVIHSLWVPSLGGKIDLIPGRVNRMALEPTKLGVYRGVCAELCGVSHTNMLLDVFVVEAPEFEAWTREQAAPAKAPASELERRGARVFGAHGCGACHTIRGTDNDGRVGPDLTHVGSRIGLGAGILPNDVPAFERWISDTRRVKPGAHMPSFDMLAKPELKALASYLDGLK